MVFLVSQFLVILFVLVGIIVWASAGRPLAWREIAINTRKDPSDGSPYTMLKVQAVCLKILAVLIWIVGIAMIVGINVAGSGLGGLFQSGPGF